MNGKGQIVSVLMASVAAMPAMAQTAPAATTANAQQSGAVATATPHDLAAGEPARPAMAPADAVPDNAPSSPGDIIVTAQRRSERLVDVPISISAISSATLATQQIQTTLDIPKMVSGMTVSHNGLWVTPAIRGIGSRVGENSVAQYVDGVYIANPVTALSEFAVVDRVEVLKGPQGTLFGRNATGGAINIITPDPNQKLDIRGSGFVEERNGRGVTGYANVPISSTVAINFSGNYRQSDGWITEAANPVRGGPQPVPVGTPINALKHSDERVKIKLTPSDYFDATLSYWHGYLSDPGAGVYPTISNTLLGYVGPAPLNQDFASIVPSNIAKFDQIAFKVNGRVGDWSLSSLSAYRNDRNTINVDVSQSLNGPVVATWDSTEKTMSQEFILTGRAGIFQPTFGLFIYNDDFSKLYGGADHQQNTFSIAPFADVTLNLSNKLKIIGGLRYTYETRDFKYLSTINTVAFSAGKAYSNVSPRAVIQYDLDHLSNIYASFSQGFKSGLFNTDATGLTSASNPAAQPLDPEKLTAYEIGYKRGDSFINIAVAGFYYDWKNIQVNRYVNGNTIAQNAAAAEIYGGDLSVTINPIHDLSVFLNGTLMHARYTSFTGGSASVQGTAGSLYDVTNISGPLVLATSQNWTGLRLLNAPDVSLNAGFNWNINGIGPGSLSISPNVRYTSRFAPNGILLTTTGTNLLDRKPVAITDLTVAYKLEHFTISVYARNLTNEQFYSEPNYNALGVYGLWQEPRTIGGKIAFNF